MVNFIQKRGVPMISINSYNVLNTLGSGAFGTTYLVEKGNNPFALKLIRENMINVESNER